VRIWDAETIITAILTTITGIIVAKLLGVWKVMRIWFYKRTLRRLKEAKEALSKEFVRDHPKLIDIDGFEWPLETLAKKAGIWQWRAEAAIRWRDDIKEYGSHLSD